MTIPSHIISHLVGVEDLSELVEAALHVLDIGDEHVDDAAPGLVEGLVPDAGPEAGGVEGLRELLEVLLPLAEYEVPLVLLHKVHLVNQAEDLRVRAVLQDGLGDMWCR